MKKPRSKDRRYFYITKSFSMKTALFHPKTHRRSVFIDILTELLQFP